MSEVQQETEVVSGVIGGITQKRADTWQVAVRPAGSQYDKNLWTKDQALVTKLTGFIGIQKTFICNVSYWQNQSGQQVRSLWIAGESEGAAAPAVTATPSRQSSTSQGVPAQSTPDVDWDEKERRKIRSLAWAHTNAMLGPVGENKEEREMLQILSVRKLAVESIYVDICRSHEFAHPNLGADVPFGEEPSVPFD